MTLTVPQRSYRQVNATPFAGRVYLYAPDIKTGIIGRGFEPFKLWIVEGVYGRPFVQGSASLDERAFEQIRRSQNVRATPINVDSTSKTPRVAFKIAKDTFVSEIVKVNTSWGGTDSVTVNICR